MLSIIISIIECLITILTISRWLEVLDYIKNSLYEPPDVERVARGSAYTHMFTAFLLLGWSAYGMFHKLYDSNLGQFWLLIVYILGYFYSEQVHSLYSKKIRMTITPKQ